MIAISEAYEGYHDPFSCPQSGARCPTSGRARRVAVDFLITKTLLVLDRDLLRST